MNRKTKSTTKVEASKDTCLKVLNSRKEFDTLKANSPFTNVVFISNSCPRCNELIPVLEEECAKIKKMTPVEVAPTVLCPVDKDFCAVEVTKEMMKDFIRGLENKEIDDTTKLQVPPTMSVPYVAGFPRGQEKVYSVHGADKERVRKNYAILAKTIDETKKKMEPGDK